MRDFELEHHNRDDDGDHSITESFQTVLSHLFKIVRWYRLKMERGHPVRQRALHAQLSFGELVRAVRAARSGGQDVRAPLRPYATTLFASAPVQWLFPRPLQAQ